MLSPLLFIYLFINTMESWIPIPHPPNGLSFITVFNYFETQLSQIWLVGAPSTWFLCLCNAPIILLSTSLLSHIIRDYWLILYLPCPKPIISHFSEKPCSFNGVCMVLEVKIWTLQVFITTRVSLLHKLWANTARKYMYI